MSIFRGMVCMVVLPLFVVGCATSGGASLKIDPGHSRAVQYMPDELTNMLADLGYQWIPVRDPETDQPVKVVETSNEYRMRFEFADRKEVRIDARIRNPDNFTRLRMYEQGSETLSDFSLELYRKLQERAALEFGANNVSH